MSADTPDRPGGTEPKEAPTVPEWVASKVANFSIVDTLRGQAEVFWMSAKRPSIDPDIALLNRMRGDKCIAHIDALCALAKAVEGCGSGDLCGVRDSIGNSILCAKCDRAKWSAIRALLGRTD